MCETSLPNKFGSLSIHLVTQKSGFRSTWTYLRMRDKFKDQVDFTPILFPTRGRVCIVGGKTHPSCLPSRVWIRCSRYQAVVDAAIADPGTSPMESGSVPHLLLCSISFSFSLSFSFPFLFYFLIPFDPLPFPPPYDCAGCVSFPLHLPFLFSFFDTIWSPPFSSSLIRFDDCAGCVPWSSCSPWNIYRRWLWCRFRYIRDWQIEQKSADIQVTCPH